MARAARDLREISDRFLEMVERETGNAFPDDPMEQLEMTVKAAFDSWKGKRAVDYRREFNITPEIANGTAVNLCTMVFGNLGDDSATGVGFTRYPDTGEDGPKQVIQNILNSIDRDSMLAGARKDILTRIRSSST